MQQSVNEYIMLGKPAEGDGQHVNTASSVLERRRVVSAAAWRGRRDDEAGLTTLEWLLIVAAVAGIAALAVVLVQNVVSDVSEQIAGSNARVVAAQLAGEQVERDATRDAGDQPPTIDDIGDWKRYYEGRCERLEITYGDAGVTITAEFKSPLGDGEKIAGDTGPLSSTKAVRWSADTTVTAAPAGGVFAKCQVTS